MIVFNDDENLGKVISKRIVTSFGVSPIKSMMDLRFSGGGRADSFLCGFRFTTALPEKQQKARDFGIVFVAKLRNSHYRSGQNPSQWYAFKFINPLEIQILSKAALFANYGFDVDKFFDSDLFAKMLPKFQQAISNGVNNLAPEFMKTLKGNEITEAQKYVDSIIKASELLNNKAIYDKNSYTVNLLFMKREAEDQLNESLHSQDALTINTIIDEATKAGANEDTVKRASQIVGIVNGKICVFRDMVFSKNKLVESDPGIIILHDGKPNSLNAINANFDKDTLFEDEKSITAESENSVLIKGTGIHNTDSSSANLAAQNVVISDEKSLDEKIDEVLKGIYNI